MSGTSVHDVSIVRTVEAPAAPFAIPPGLGITRLGDLTGLDTIGLPVWSAVRPLAWSLAQSQGKGLTDAQAQRSALMEAAETALAEEAFRRVVARGSPADLAARGEPVIALEQFGKCLDPQKAQNRVYDWLEGHGLMTGNRVLVPLPMVSLDFRLQSEEAMQPFHLSSTGLAAHTDRRAAQLHGLLEQIETDALALAQAWPGILQRAPAPDLSADDADLAGIAARLERAGLQPDLRDLTSDLGVPVVLCRLRESGAFVRKRPIGGIACRPSSAAAARHAMLEAVQTRLTEISGAREDIRNTDYDLTNDATAPAPGTLPSLARPILAADPQCALKAVLSRFGQAGLPEPVSVNLERPSDDFACVAILCPGLEAGSAAEGYRPGARAKSRIIRHALGLP